jgi:hypothetical protein
MTLAVLLVLGLGALAVAGPPPTTVASPVADDVGLIVAVSGDVTLKSGTASYPVTAYMKVRAGDTIDVPTGGSVDLVYFSGRREAWHGPSRILAQADADPAAPTGATVASVPPEASRDLGTVALLLHRAEADRAGQTLVRGQDSVEGSARGPLPGQPSALSSGGGRGRGAVERLDEYERAEVEQARAAYAEWRKTAAADDPLPELALAGTLLTFGLDAEAIVVLERAVAACPTCAEPKVLLDWVTGRPKK